MIKTISIIWAVVLSIAFFADGLILAEETDENYEEIFFEAEKKKITKPPSCTTTVIVEKPSKTFSSFNKNLKNRY
uniref:Secreted protein n=1 Tax=Panagrolaimus sp. PS1159 TaxID=55785 RepID=A0AC35F7A7_9BILA